MRPWRVCVAWGRDVSRHAAAEEEPRRSFRVTRMRIASTRFRVNSGSISLSLSLGLAVIYMRRAHVRKRYIRKRT